MPLDHYIPQVHLKNFYDPALGERMHAIRKTDGGRYTCDSYSQCRVPDGSTNHYLAQPRAIEDFLKSVEPVYNEALRKLRARQLDAEAVFAIAGFAGYIHACSPTGMRINTGPIKQALEASTEMIDEMDKFPPPPADLGGETITELLRNKDITVKVDPKYPQSIGIGNIIRYTSLFGNSRWDVFHNDESGNVFLTSDFPVAIEADGPGKVNRLVPLAPDLAIRIRPDMSQSRKLDLTFQNLRVAHRRPARQELAHINRHIVQCAESVVYASIDATWIPGFIAKNGDYRVDAVSQRVPTTKGEMLLSSMAIVRR
ncbi:DUF4238 domain-containing protein [Sinorhizobium meliloti]|uniref:DUF4238 domain-containing protein n=1 Tax=Rhizobium meliloti TaxID=382 RepID=UPI000FD334C5|nr:DUF4238 domain-containing protein [Sinorhizobium meliloti]RVK12977.1 DUF4238 domain-containing protein [Sinorhizobium meliloti]RVL53372.1 DUF4238 domain-containing protein [Sinorhizobium meliloti]RVL71183.1 DUF4238 domain-containing protein [Sinorhizobium meliloti]RVM27752.1 DUF4238 domain-containing protein [Sinorhizobium meliloti]RVP62730.1 DUF4238 domain-containing protein [Sinorhizobium meliloti]